MTKFFIENNSSLIFMLLTFSNEKWLISDDFIGLTSESGFPKLLMIEVAIFVNE